MSMTAYGVGTRRDSLLPTKLLIAKATAIQTLRVVQTDTEKFPQGEVQDY
jgi:hypothetical protein